MQTLVIALQRESYNPEREGLEFTAVPRSKVGCTGLTWWLRPVACNNRRDKIFLFDVNTAASWAVKAFGELAVRIARILPALRAEDRGRRDGGGVHGDSGRRDGGGTEGESDERAGVHIEDLC